MMAYHMSYCSKVDHAFIITVEVLLAFLVIALLNVSVSIKFLQTQHLEFQRPRQPSFLSSGYSLDLITQSIIFLAQLCETIGWKKCLDYFITLLIWSSTKLSG